MFPFYPYPITFLSREQTKKYNSDFIPVFREGGIEVLSLCLEKLIHLFTPGDFHIRFQQLLGIRFQQFQDLQAPVQLPSLPLLHSYTFKITRAQLGGIG